MKRGLFSIFKYCFLIALVVILFPLSVRADMGPKPSVKINVRGLGDQDWYMTLVAPVDAYFHSDVLEGLDDWTHDDEEEAAVFQIFRQYSDQDEFYFLGHLQKRHGDEFFDWTYYPPERFKILIYLPDSDSTLLYDQVIEKYAFDCYYTLTISDLQVVEGDRSSASFKLKKDYIQLSALGSFAVRLLATVLIEMFLAVCFLYHRKEQYQVIFKTNVCTQIILNILILILSILTSSLLVVLLYIPMEFVVFIIEAVVYRRSRYMQEKADGTKVFRFKSTFYALIANAASFLVGAYIYLMFLSF